MVDAVEAEAAEVADASAADDDIQQSEPVEDKARRLGWRPKDEFKGPEDKWIDADAFVTRGDEILPIVQANNKALEKTVKALEAKLAQTDKTLAEAAEFFSKTEERAYKRALADLKSDHADAVALGDLAAAEKALDGITELAAEMPKPKAAPAASPVFQSWSAENQWFNVDEDLTAYALGLRFPEGTPEDEQFRLIAAKVRKTFPAKFEPPANPRRAAPAAVEGAQNGRRSSAKGWADLPPEAKSQADRFIKDKIVASRDDYVRNYDFGA